MRILKTTVCFAALCTATGAMADVTAQQVWGAWQSNFEDAPKATLSTSSEYLGNGVVTVSDLMLSVINEDQSVSVDFGTVTFTEQGDGKVAVQMEDSYVIDIQSEGSDSATIEINQPGLVMIVTGSDQFMRYSVNGQRMQ